MSNRTPRLRGLLGRAKPEPDTAPEIPAKKPVTIKKGGRNAAPKQ